MKLSSEDRNKIDINDDMIFYDHPRYVNHLSFSFRERLTKLYSKYILDDYTILDLMSSWVSHLPTNKEYKKIIGHGMNESELKANKRLDSFWIQNFNKSQKMPIEDSTFDIGLVVAGWQYLQYPEMVALELSRIIKSDSLLIVSFTNRAFWTKSPNIWTNSSEEGRIDYVKSVLSDCGWIVEKIFNETTFENKLFGVYSSESDPFFSVIARNNKSNN
tara:strand:+ start:286 stop:936 length:651 start_codon:yes stop_codon:yes gene_type:complete